MLKLFCRGVLILSCIIIAVGAHAAHATESDRLKQIITECLDISGETYCNSCATPRSDSVCAVKECRKSIEVWKEAYDYIAIRDRKMCDCASPGFVHGLAIPRAVISGVEAGNRPNSIWSFAWQVAIARKIPEIDAALIINPKNERSQNQMHIHMLRLSPGARSLFQADMSTSVDSLDKVWIEAKRLAEKSRLADYGILVARSPKGGFVMLVSEKSPEDLYTIARCPTVAP
jgi:CDP-diacylglycerol pyrophosphatase